MWWSMPRGSVALPGPATSPTDVVRAYVRALDARDYTTSNSIQTMGPDLEQHGWFGGPTITHLKITGAAPVATGADFPDSRVTRYRQVAVVDTDAVFHDWSGMQDGRQPWSYYLVRSSSTQPWRIADWGQG